MFKKKTGFWLLLCGIFPLLIAINTVVAEAHPHIFIDSSIEVVFDEKGLAGMQMTWIFDEMTSTGFFLDYDTDRNGSFSLKEKRILKQKAFDYLKNYEYMTHIEIDGKVFTITYVKNFNPVIKHDRLVYRFFIPCHVTAHRQFKKISIAVYDEGYYVDFNQNKRSVKLRGSDTFETTTRFWTNRNKSYYFEQFHPKEFILSFKNR